MGTEVMEHDEFPTDLIAISTFATMQYGRRRVIRDGRQQLMDLLGSLAQAAEHAAEDLDSMAADCEAEDITGLAAGYREDAARSWAACAAARKLCQELCKYCAANEKETKT